MKLFCKCLNVCIRIIEDSINDKLLRDDCSEFLNEELIQVELQSINYQFSNLIKILTHGRWNTYECVNCNFFIYASDKETSVFVNKNLISDPAEISELSLSVHYSPAFKIILKTDDFINEDIYEHRLNEVAAHWLREEAQRTEERIKNFTEEQYAALENLRQRALKDDLIINRKLDAANKVNNPKVDKSEETKEVSETTSEKVKHKYNKFIDEDSTNDVGDTILFPLDDFDHPYLSKDYSDGPSDNTEDEDESYKTVYTRRNSSLTLAKSLPIPVPQYMHELTTDAKLNGSYQNSIKNLQSPPVPADIAASIKALAKSVHGDSVFGELPRPRCQNNL